jgi:hypothetical protein
VPLLGHLHDALLVWEHLGPRAAWADDADASVREFLERYRRAMEGRDLGTLATLYVEFPAKQRAALEQYFAGVRNCG